jgi:sodium/hydrogen antiporter
MTTALVYVAIGALLGPVGLHIVAPNLAEHGRIIEAVTEAVLLFALFSTALRLRLPAHFAWREPLRFATVSTLGTMLLVSVAARYCLHVDLPVALLLGAILAPADAVLTAAMRTPAGEDANVRSLLAAEGSIGTILAVPFLLLAAGFMGVHDLGHGGVRWAVFDLLWAITGGLLAGWLAGALSWRVFVRARATRDTELPEEVIAVGTIALACGGAMLLGASTFAAVFAAGLALAHGGRLRQVGHADRPSGRFVEFAGRLEHFAAVAALLLLGALFDVRDLRPAVIIFALLVLVLARPLAARLALGWSVAPPGQKQLAGWLGMRGVASLYLLALGANHGLNASLARELTGIVTVVLVTCLAIQAVAVTSFLRKRADQRA